MSDEIAQNIDQLISDIENIQESLRSVEEIRDTISQQDVMEKQQQDISRLRAKSRRQRKKINRLQQLLEDIQLENTKLSLTIRVLRNRDDLDRHEIIGLSEVMSSVDSEEKARVIAKTVAGENVEQSEDEVRDMIQGEIEAVKDRGENPFQYNKNQ
jgi:hypothetical protein